MTLLFECIHVSVEIIYRMNTARKSAMSPSTGLLNMHVQATVSFLLQNTVYSL